MFAPADAAPCSLDALQPLFTDVAANAARIAPMLRACVESGSSDPRLPLLRGVFARARGDFAESAALLAQARAADPTSVPALLESGVTDEQRERLSSADAFYHAALRLAPNDRAALLGLARVAGAEYRFADATAIYRQLLAVNPRDAAALDGMGRLAIARRDPAAARRDFEAALAANPNDPEAHTGLVLANRTWTSRLDVGGGFTNTSDGDAWSEGALFTQRIGSADSVTAGALHNSNELPAVGLTDQRPLPLDDVEIRWDHQDYHAFAWGVQYDDRVHSGLPSEQWTAATVSTSVGNAARVFAGYRATFGAPEWDGYLASLGALVSVGGNWSVQGTAFGSAYHPETALNIFAPSRSTGSGDIEVQRQTGREGLFAGGIGYSPSFGTAIEHARATIPLSDSSALLIMVSHQTNIPQTRASVAARFQW